VASLLVKSKSPVAVIAVPAFGAMALTIMLLLAPSRARVLLKAINPALANI
jgi:hypothetical protein